MINKKGIEMEQTRSPEKTSPSSIKDLVVNGESKTIRLKGTFDLPGSEEYRDNGKWQEVFNDADIVLYFVHAAALLRGIDKRQTQLRVMDDLQNLQKWNDQLKTKNKNIFIIGNHFDEIDEKFNNGDRIENYEKEFSENEAIKRYSQRMTKIIGSLKTRDTMKDILEKVVNIMETKR